MYNAISKSEIRINTHLFFLKCSVKLYPLYLLVKIKTLYNFRSESGQNNNFIQMDGNTTEMH